MAVFLPDINMMVVKGFDKLFKSDEVIIDFSRPLNILLGGNGLGKTTLLQCIIYALTGGTNSHNVEPIRSMRWDNNFFKRRVNQEKLSSASIKVKFTLNNVELEVTRGLLSNKPIEFAANGISYEKDSYEYAVMTVGKYSSYDNFVFIVNRLLYLPENRRSLMWDYEAQLRSLMILSNDIIDEEEYRLLRAEIKNLDSAKRHTTVRINKLETAIKEQRESSDEETIYVLDEVAKDKTALALELKELLTARDIHEKQLRTHEARIRELASDIEQISSILSEHESYIIQESLKTYEDKALLLFDKSINYGICPCCGERSREFKDITKQRMLNGECIICGNKNSKIIELDIDIDALNAQLSEKLSARDNANHHVFQLQNRLIEIDKEIFNIRKSINEIEYNEYINADKNEDSDDEEINEYELAKLLSDREGLASDIVLKTKQADDIYSSFQDHFIQRSDRLSAIYRNLATSFLGKEVSLEYEDSLDKFVRIKYLIPRFDDEVRRNSEDCSEAQRFFLDIAFRLSLISLNHELTKSYGTFICETPESALDVSYIDNVIVMFLQFINNNKLILSNNLQRLGLASRLVSKSKKDEIHIFDLLNYGKLSDVQQDSPELFEIRDEIIKGVQ